MNLQTNSEPGEEQINAALEAVRNLYETRIEAILAGMRKCLIAQGWNVPNAAYEMSDGEYSWWLSAYRPGGTEEEDNMVDVRFEIAESRSYDGDQPFGINFGLEAVEWGGRPVTEVMPYNFTDQVWVDARDAQAVEERFKLIEEVDLDAFAAHMTES